MNITLKYPSVPDQSAPARTSIIVEAKGGYDIYALIRHLVTSPAIHSAQWLQYVCGDHRLRVWPSPGYAGTLEYYAAIFRAARAAGQPAALAA